jgi:hypothetical protein
LCNYTGGICNRNIKISQVLKINNRIEFQRPRKAVEFYAPEYGRCCELKRDKTQRAEESAARLWHEVL